MGKNKVVRSSRLMNVERMDKEINYEPLDEVDCFKHLESQLAADGECAMDLMRRMNEGNIRRRERRIMYILSNRGKGKSCEKESV